MKWLVTVLLFLLVVLFFPVLVISPSHADLPEVDQKIVEELQTEDAIDVIVTLEDKPAITSLAKSLRGDHVSSDTEIEEAILENLEDDEFELRHQYDDVNGFSGKLTEEGLDELASNPAVEKISYDYPVRIMLDASIPHINADDVWNKQISSTNITGADVSICVIDSGVDTDHENLQGRIVAEKCYCSDGDGCCPDGTNEDNSAEDDHGHGTHVSGIIASNHATIKGVAYGANIVAVKVLDNNGEGYMSDVVSAIEWCNANRAAYNISVITMSLGCWGSSGFNTVCDSSSTCNSDDVATAVNAAVANGIFVVAASGNCEDNDCIGHSGSTTHISSPACVANVIAVAATNSTDDVTSYSNRNNLVDMVAPGGDTGEEINSTYFTGGFCEESGTSMSAPHVAGAAALLIQAKNLLSAAWTPAKIFNALNSTGVDINDAGGSGEHFHRVDVLAAYNDFIPLQLNPEFPINGTYYNYDVEWLNITTDRTLGIANVSLDGGANQSMNNDTTLHYFLDLTGAPINTDGWHNASYWINSSDGDSSDIVYFFIDKTDPPAISGLANQSAGESWIYWSWTDPVDGESGLSHIEAYRDGTNVENVSAGQQGYNMTCLNPDTMYELATRTADLAGNVNTSWQNNTASTHIDSSGPSISVSIPGSGASYSSSTLIYTLTATDPSELSTCLVSTDGGSNQTLSFSDNTCDAATSVYSPSATVSSGSLSTGLHNVVFYCNDTGGNAESSSVSFTIGSSGSSGTGGSGSSGGASSDETCTSKGYVCCSRCKTGTAHSDLSSTCSSVNVCCGECDYKVSASESEITNDSAAKSKITGGAVTDKEKKKIELGSRVVVTGLVVLLACLAVFAALTIVSLIKRTK